MQGAWGWSLVGELRSCMVRPKNKKSKQTCLESGPSFPVGAPCKQTICDLGNVPWTQATSVTQQPAWAPSSMTSGQSKSWGASCAAIGPKDPRAPALPYFEILRKCNWKMEMCKSERDVEREKGKGERIDFGNYQPVNLTYAEIQQPLIKISSCQCLNRMLRKSWAVQLYNQASWTKKTSFRDKTAEGEAPMRSWREPVKALPPRFARLGWAAVPGLRRLGKA